MLQKFAFLVFIIFLSYFLHGSANQPLCPTYTLRSKRVILNSQTPPSPKSIHISNGKIVKISNWDDVPTETSTPCKTLLDVGDHVIMPGMVDTHVHINEPGRTHWEGMKTATKAAAAGGITTVVDMPLNSIPPTTTVENLKTKINAVHGKMYVDVGFLGGIVPGNEKQIKQLLKEGVLGFKSFMINSGVDEFEYTPESSIKKGLEELKGTNVVYMFHAELPVNVSTQESNDPNKFITYLQTRPEEMELEAIQLLIKLCKDSHVRCHIVHVAAPKALPMLKNVQGMTAETCTHYLYFAAEDVPDGQTLFKCAPPIREAEKREMLWEGLRQGVLSMVTSDHSPSPMDLKSSNFLKSWGGISSLQYSLPALWTAAMKRGFKLQDLVSWKCEKPAELVGLQQLKGKIEVGFDADFVVWSPEESFIVNENECYHKHKKSPYDGHQLNGVVKTTILRGNVVFNDRKFPSGAAGKILRAQHS